MAGTTTRTRKEEITQLLNNILDLAARTRQGFTPEVVTSFYEEGLRASEHRAEQAGARRYDDRSRPEPSRLQLSDVVVRRSEDRTAVRSISPLITRRAVEAAISLGEQIELAAVEGRGLNLANWVRG
jgi:hypothetical protein